MAKKTVIKVVDDIDGAELEVYETVRWGIDGRQFEFDTSPANAELFRSHMASYVTVSRAVTGPASRRQKPTKGPSSQRIREWANANGFNVSVRGRIPGEVLTAYAAAH
ncbi:Lsr2 family protein [Gordonia malaquae]|uniref:histone-like nucleoid-structuring protein Lsr2 n=1 Tax=Gordonia malaquae TaxID=410332 RepID=UPI0030FE62D4